MNELNEQQRSELYRLLLKLSEELRQLLADTDEGAQPVSLDEPIGRLSRVAAMQQQSMLQANRSTARIRLARMESALRRHASGEYGSCAGCEEEIGYARLKANPEAPFCMVCQEKSETRGA